jgi:hypothetical protein
VNTITHALGSWAQLLMALLAVAFLLLLLFSLATGGGSRS